MKFKKQPGQLLVNILNESLLINTITVRVCTGSPDGFLVTQNLTALPTEEFGRVSVSLRGQPRAQSGCVGSGGVEEAADGLLAGGMEDGVKRTLLTYHLNRIKSNPWLGIPPLLSSECSIILIFISFF